VDLFALSFGSLALLLIVLTLLLTRLHRRQMRALLSMQQKVNLQAALARAEQEKTHRETLLELQRQHRKGRKRDKKLIESLLSNQTTLSQTYSEVTREQIGVNERLTALVAAKDVLSYQGIVTMQPDDQYTNGEVFDPSDEAEAERLAERDPSGGNFDRIELDVFDDIASIDPEFFSVPGDRPGAEGV